MSEGNKETRRKRRKEELKKIKRAQSPPLSQYDPSGVGRGYLRLNGSSRNSPLVLSAGLHCEAGRLRSLGCICVNLCRADRGGSATGLSHTCRRAKQEDLLTTQQLFY